jgi:hypothetical protein
MTFFMGLLLFPMSGRREGGGSAYYESFIIGSAWPWCIEAEFATETVRIESHLSCRGTLAAPCSFG